MDRAEIVSILRIIRTGHFGQAREAIEAAIAELEPQPVTEAGLREAGLQDSPHWRLELHGGRASVEMVDGQWRLSLLNDGIHLHITDMQQLRSVIAALRATP